jgi:hypothetical protein
MDNAHPHTGATYQIHEQADGGYGVVVTIPDTPPARVTGFGTRAAAEAWIANHQKEIANGNSLRRRAFLPSRDNGAQR